MEKVIPSSHTQVPSLAESVPPTQMYPVSPLAAAWMAAFWAGIGGGGGWKRAACPERGSMLWPGYMSLHRYARPEVVAAGVMAPVAVKAVARAVGWAPTREGMVEALAVRVGLGWAHTRRPREG
jgi:hypothetical protein